jgi:murein DD-endopeptidase MepM/ murein hydrolase activator NlpD
MATWYGGVVVQQCELEKQPVTIIYGHLKFTSITISTKVIMKAGEKIGILWKGYSSETDWERKHLHLGIHKGKTINILGYVSLSKYLSDWIDPMKYLK